MRGLTFSGANLAKNSQYAIPFIYKKHNSICIIIFFQTKKGNFVAQMNKKDKSFFHFKQFSVGQDLCEMKVGTDAVLLGAMAGVHTGEVCVLDLGCGSGVIALMLAQRFPEARILGIDIDQAAAEQAARNFSASPWADRLTAMNGDVRKIGEGLQLSTIVCNPPFYTNGPSSSSVRRDMARRTDTLSFEDLAATASHLLCEGGWLEVIIPYASASDFVHICWLHDFNLIKRTDIRTKSAKPFTRSVLTFEKSSATPIFQSSSFTLLDLDGTPSSEYRALTRDFYINM